MHQPYSSVMNTGDVINLDISVRTYLSMADNPDRDLYAVDLADPLSPIRSLVVRSRMRAIAGNVCSSICGGAMGYPYPPLVIKFWNEWPYLGFKSFSILPRAKSLEVADFICNRGGHIEYVTEVVEDPVLGLMISLFDMTFSGIRTRTLTEAEFNYEAANREYALLKYDWLNRYDVAYVADPYSPIRDEVVAVPALPQAVKLSRGFWRNYRPADVMRLNVTDVDAVTLKIQRQDYDDETGVLIGWVDEASITVAGAEIVNWTVSANTGKYRTYIIRANTTESVPVEFGVAQVHCWTNKSTISVGETIRVTFTTEFSSAVALILPNTEHGFWQGRNIYFLTDQDRQKGYVDWTFTVPRPMDYSVIVTAKNEFGTIKVADLEVALTVTEA